LPAGTAFEYYSCKGGIMRTNKIYLAGLIASLLFSGILFSQNGFSSMFEAHATLSQIKFDEKPLSYKPDYKNAIGIRAGGTSGITYKHFFNSYDAFEGIFGLWPNAFGITGLYERHAPTGAPGLKFYYGGGGHITGETDHYYYRYRDDYVYRYGRNGLGIGIDGILGIEYKIPVIPFAISFDLKPYIEVSNYGNIFTAIDPALGIKVAF
jgi:hypothetical protein